MQAGFPCAVSTKDDSLNMRTDPLKEPTREDLERAEAHMYDIDREDVVGMFFSMRLLGTFQ